MLFDMHVHTHESSNCGHIDGADVARNYKNAGYDGIVVTDHFCYPYFELYKDKTWKELCDRHHKGYLEAKKVGDEIGLCVLYGCEIRFKHPDNDYLVYGMPNEFLVENPDILVWDVKKFSQACTDNGFLLYQAHPFRNGMTVTDPSLLFGIEVFNGKPTGENPTRNAFANIWAEKFGLHKISGSDCHKEDEFARAGINFMTPIKNENDLISALREDKYMLTERVGTQVSSLSDCIC